MDRLTDKGTEQWMDKGNNKWTYQWAKEYSAKGIKITKMRGKPIESFIYVIFSSFFNKMIQNIIIFVLLGFICPNIEPI